VGLKNLVCSEDQFWRCFIRSISSFPKVWSSWSQGNTMEQCKSQFSDSKILLQKKCQWWRTPTLQQNWKIKAYDYCSKITCVCDRTSFFVCASSLYSINQACGVTRSQRFFGGVGAQKHWESESDISSNSDSPIESRFISHS